MRVSEPALSQAVLPSLAKAGINEREKTQRSARIGRARAGVRPRTLRERHRLYLLARLIVKRHYRESLTLQVLAKALATCPRQLQRAYAQSGTGTFHEDLTARRMTAAAELLCHSAIPVREVALGRLSPCLPLLPSIPVAVWTLTGELPRQARQHPRTWRSDSVP